MSRVSRAIATAIVLSLTCTSTVLAQTTAPRPNPLAAIPPPALSGFNVTLVVADRSGSGPSDQLAAGPAKALADLQELMSFKRYRLLDAQWIAGSTRTPIRLRGLDGKMYALNLQAKLALPTRVVVSACQLWEVPASGSGGRTGTGKAEGDEAAFAGDPIIDTSFGLAVGETVVVGSSALAGDSALVILLTAKGR